MVDVLNLEWHSGPTRDNYISTLVCNYLQYKGYNVIRGCIFEGKRLIYKHKPRLVFLANGIGAPVNFEIVQFAKKFGCLVITGVSEGNIKKFAVEQMFWGWNNKKILYENINLQWSYRSKHLITDIYPELNSKIKVSGGIGFDIYKIMPNKKESEIYFRKKYNIPANMPIVGFACWDFGVIYPEDPRYNTVKKHYLQDQINRFKRDGEELNKILLKLVKNNSNLFFLIKEHPGSLLGEKASAIIGLNKFSNVLIIKNEESISHCIKASNIWLGYETTTALEAWLTGLHTILINPSGADFKRDSLYKGSIITINYEETNKKLMSFFKKNTLREFENLGALRKKEIESVIQWDDGLNHKRAGDYIIELLKSSDTKRKKMKTRTYFAIIREIISVNVFFLDSYKNWGQNKNHQKKIKNFNKDELKKFEQEIMKHQIKYLKNNLTAVKN